MELSIVVGEKNKTVFVRASEKSAGNYGIITRKTGFIEVDSMKSAEELKKAIEDNVLAVAFGKLNPQNGNYAATVLPVEAAATAEAAKEGVELKHEA